MKMPFSTDEFLSIFHQYNVAVWPFQWVFNLLAILTVVSIAKDGKHSNRIAFSILAFFWIWMGLVYHLIFFSAINPVAKFFGIVFMVQGLIFLINGVYNQRIKLRFHRDLSGILGGVFIVYALVLYPASAFLLGHRYPYMPTFGVPCPTTIFTFGMLLFSTTRLPWYAVIIPLLWSLIGFSAAVNLSMWEDLALVVTGAVSCGIILFIKPKARIGAGMVV